MTRSEFETVFFEARGEVAGLKQTETGGVIGSPTGALDRILDLIEHLAIQLRDLEKSNEL